MTTFFSRLGVHSKLMGRMMTRCGIDPVRLAQDRFGATVTAAAQTCMACGRTESCRRWLDVTEDGVLQEPPSFCPNARRFAAFQQV